jgi:chemotaxis protein MotB
MTDKIQQSFGGKPDSNLANTIQQINLESDISSEIKGFIDANNLGSYAVVQVDEYQIKLMLTQAIMFQLGKANLLDKSKPVLNKLSEMLKGIQNNIIIEGHTDDIPVYNGSNFELSSLRALSVADYLISNGIEKERIAIAGYGPFRPLVENSSNENRATNRRVEILIISQHSNFMEVY